MGFEFDGFSFVEAPNTKANRQCDSDEDLEDAVVTYDSRTKCKESATNDEFDEG